jgi:hypothetical protein
VRNDSSPFSGQSGLNSVQHGSVTGQSPCIRSEDQEANQQNGENPLMRGLPFVCNGSGFKATCGVVAVFIAATCVFLPCIPRHPIAPQKELPLDSPARKGSPVNGQRLQLAQFPQSAQALWRGDWKIAPATVSAGPLSNPKLISS